MLLSSCLGPARSEAKQEIVTVTSRYDVSEGGREITLPCLLDIPEGREVTALLLVIPRGNGWINLRTRDGKILHDVNNDPFIRNTALFHERSVGLAMPDVPSDRDKGFGIAYRKTREHAADIAAVLKDLRNRLPKAKVYLAASGERRCFRPLRRRQPRPRLEWHHTGRGSTAVRCMPTTTPS